MLTRHQQSSSLTLTYIGISAGNATRDSPARLSSLHLSRNAPFFSFFSFFFCCLSGFSLLFSPILFSFPAASQFFCIIFCLIFYFSVSFSVHFSLQTLILETKQALPSHFTPSNLPGHCFILWKQKKTREKPPKMGRNPSSRWKKKALRAWTWKFLQQLLDWNMINLILPLNSTWDLPDMDASS